MWVCGLKRNFSSCNRKEVVVAPHAGALVEVQIAIQCWGVCIGVALAVGDETTADGAEFHPPLLCLPSV